MDFFGPKRAVQNGPPRGPRRRVEVTPPLGQVLTPGDEIGRGNAPTVDEHAGHLGVEPVERSPQRDGHGSQRDGLPEAVRVLAVRAGRRHELELGELTVEFVLVQVALDDVGDIRSPREQFDDLRPTVPVRAGGAEESDLAGRVSSAVRLLLAIPTVCVYGEALPVE